VIAPYRRWFGRRRPIVQLANAHRDLDAAVAAAYGWPADISEDKALSRLLALNLERAMNDR
jgi:hypothetical protein